MGSRIHKLVFVLFPLHAGVVLVLLYLPCQLFIRAETAGGRLVGACFLLLLAGSLAPWMLRFRKTRRAGMVITGFCLIMAVFCVGMAAHIAPTGIAPADSGFTPVRQGQVRFNRYALSNIVPEIDQLKLGSFLFQYVDPVIDTEQAGRIRQLLVDVYSEMRHDRAFVEAGSALGLCYEDILTGKRRTLHYYQYVPRQLNLRTYPVLIFVHGSLGNFKGYMWVLKSLADSAGYAIIAPSFGCGNWRLDGECSVLTSIYEQCAKDPILDHQSIYLMGLSNGGLGVTREMQQHGNRYQGIVLVSPVMDLDALFSSQAQPNMAGKPLLLIHGLEDRRIPAAYVRDVETRLRTGDLDLTSHYYPDEDHFLLFSQRAPIMAELENWLAETGPQQ